MAVAGLYNLTAAPQAPFAASNRDNNCGFSYFNKRKFSVMSSSSSSSLSSKGISNLQTMICNNNQPQNKRKIVQLKSVASDMDRCNLSLFQQQQKLMTTFQSVNPEIQANHNAKFPNKHIQILCAYRLD